MTETGTRSVTLRVDYGNSSEAWWQALWQRLETEPGKVPEALRRLVHPRSNDAIEVSLAEAPFGCGLRPVVTARSGPAPP